MRVQSELGVVFRLRGSSLTGCGRVSARGSVNDCESDCGLAVGFRPSSGFTEHTSTTDCSTHMRTPRSVDFKTELLFSSSNHTCIYLDKISNTTAQKYYVKVEVLKHSRKAEIPLNCTK